MAYYNSIKSKVKNLYYEKGYGIRSIESLPNMPTRNTIRAWVKDDPRYELKKLDYLPDHADTVRTEVLRLFIAEKKSLSEISKIEGMPCLATICRWLREYDNSEVLNLGIDSDCVDISKCNTRESTKKKMNRDLEKLVKENEELKKENANLRFEAEAAKALVKTLKKELGLNAISLTNKEKAQMIDSLRPQFKLKTLLTAFNLHPASYAYQKNAMKVPDKCKELRALVLSIHYESNSIFGYRRVLSVLRNKFNRFDVGPKLVKRLMKEEGIRGRQGRKNDGRPRGTILCGAVPNILSRNFKSSRPYEKWATDVTELKVGASKYYLSPLIDLFSGEIISYSIASHSGMALIMDMMTEKVKIIAERNAPILHTDQGWQYQHPDFTNFLSDCGIVHSMSRKGNCIDNAPVESFFGRFKTEFYYGRRFANSNDFIKELRNYIQWFNHGRIKIGLEGLSPTDYRLIHSKNIS